MSTQFFKASKEAIKNIFRPANTVLFPTTHVPVPDGLRGVPKLKVEKCSLCGRCERACPTGAIAIEKTGKKEGFLIIDLGLCCYCQECENNCNFDGIELSTEWLTSQMVREKLVTKYEIKVEEE